MEFYLSALLQGLCFSGLALGIFISMKIFNIPDITTDGSYTLGGVISAVLLSKGFSFISVLPLAMLAGALAGTITGIIHTKLKVNPLLAGILVMTALYSVNLSLMGRSNLPLINYTTVFTGIIISADADLNSLLLLLIFVTLLVLVLGYLLRTDFGIAMRATGSSETMVRAMGVNTDRMKITGLAMANALTAASGYLISQLQGFADINMGIGIVIVGLGSVIVGEAVISRFISAYTAFSLVMVIAGAMLFQLVLAFALSIGIDASLLKLLIASFVLIIVSVPRLLSKAES